MKKTYIWGAGRLSGVMLQALVDNSAVPRAYYLEGGSGEHPEFVVNREFLPKTEKFQSLEFGDLQYFLLYSQAFKKKFPIHAIEDINGTHKVYVLMGYRNLNRDRQGVFLNLEELGWTVLSFTHNTSPVHGKIKGHGNIILSSCRVQVDSVLGTGNVLYDGTHIGHHCSIGDWNYFTTGSVICGGATIGNNCFIGANATICPDVTINDYCVVGAGAVVSRDLPPYSVAIAGLNNIIDKKSTEINLK